MAKKASKLAGSFIILIQLFLLIFPYTSCEELKEDMFPYGVENGDIRMFETDDGFDVAPLIFGNFKFFNNTYNRVFISNNGILSFVNGKISELFSALLKIVVPL